MFAETFNSVRRVGLKRLVPLLLQKAFSDKRFAQEVMPHLVGHGLEVGGPSGRFGASGVLPLYSRCETLDNVNFASDTAWEANLEHGGDYAPEGTNLGIQYVREASDLGFPDSTFDFVASSHMLEHTANPIKTLIEWSRVTKQGGHLLLVMPHGEGTFDRKRPFTPLEHLREDFAREQGEDDGTHMAEILELHDYGRDPGMTRTRLERDLAANASSRVAHHHVFRLSNACEMAASSGWQPVWAGAILPYDIVVLAQKVESPTAVPLNTPRSPFRADRFFVSGAAPRRGGP